MTDDDRLDPALLAAYEVPDPSPGLADRFVARLAPVAVPRRRYAAAAAVLVVAAAAIVALVVRGVVPIAASGSASPTARTTEKLGERGVAVVEPGGSLGWEVTAAGAAHVHQDRGDVFYRIERGSEPFEVATAQGVVRVRGTCFRVVLEEAGTTVTVYEGSVELASARGQIVLAAGDRGLAATGQPPKLISGPTLAAPPIASATLAELLLRDRAQRERIATLEAQIGSSARTTDAISAIHHRSVADMTHDQAVELAQRCMVPHDIEPIAGSTVMDSIIERGAKDVSLTDAEHAALDRVIEKTQPAYEEGLRKLYQELTGEAGASLDPMTLVMEITQKSPAAETALAFQRVSAERVAGAVAPSSDPKTPVIERYVRFMIASADAFETQLAAEIGHERAREFRRTWGGVNLAPKCPDTNP